MLCLFKLSLRNDHLWQTPVTKDLAVSHSIHSHVEIYKIP